MKQIMEAIDFVIDFIGHLTKSEKRDNVDRRKRKGGRPRKPKNENRVSQRRN